MVEPRETSGSAALRRLAPRDAGGGPRVEIAGRTLLNFASDDLLGLSTDPRVAQAARHAVDRFGVGTGSSAQFTGRLALHDELCETLAAHLHVEQVELFASGWEAGAEAIGALTGRDDALFVDASATRCLAQGAKISGAKIVDWTHLDVADLRERMASEAVRGERWVATDGVFPETADLAPLAAIAELAREANAKLVVYDALGVGVLGPQGRGSAAHAGVAGAVHATIGSLGRAFGSQGGFVAGSRAMIVKLAERASALRDSVAVAPPLAAAALAALRIAQREPGRVASLMRHVERLRAELAAMGLPIAGDPAAPRVLVPVGRALETRELAIHLQAAGLLVLPVLPPAVAEGACGIALVPMATHTDTDLDDVMMAFASANPALLPGRR